MTASRHALIFAEYVPPYMSSDRRIFELAKGFASWSAAFCVLPPIRILAGRKQEAALQEYFREHFPASGTSVQTVRGIEARYLSIPRVLRSLWRTWMPAAYALSVPYYVIEAYGIFRARKPDVIVLAHPSYLAGVVGRLVAHLLRVPVVLDYPDAWTPLAIETSGIRPHGLWARTLYFLERCVTRSVNHVVTITHSLIPYTRAMGCRASESVVPNGADPAVFRPEFGDRRALLAAYGIPENARVIVYAGRLESWSGVDKFVRLVATVAERFPQAVFLVVGDGSALEDLRREVSDASLDRNVRFLGLRRYDEMPSVIGGADLAIVPFPLTAATIPCSPLKLFEYMLMRIPIVATNLPGIAESVGNAVRLANEPLDETFAQAVIELLEDPQAAARLAALGHDLALRSHAWPVLAQRYERVLFQATGGTGPMPAEPNVGVEVAAPER